MNANPKRESELANFPGRDLIKLIQVHKISVEVALKRALKLRQQELGTRHTGLTNAAKLLRQLLWWAGASWCEGRDAGWFYKTAPEMERESGLSRRNQDTSRQILVAFGLMREQLRYVPALNKTMMHYCPEIDPLVELINSVLMEASEKNGGRGQLRIVRNEPAPDPIPALSPVAGFANPERADPPTLDGETSQDRLAGCANPSMLATVTSAVTTMAYSHSARAREVEVSPVQAEGREGQPLDFQTWEPEPEPPAAAVSLIVVGDGSPVLVHEAEPELSVDDLAEKLILVQQKFFPVTAKDRVEASDIAQRAIEQGLSERQILEIAYEEMAVLSKKSNQFHAGLSAAAFPIGKRLICGGRRYSTAAPAGKYAGREAASRTDIEARREEARAAVSKASAGATTRRIGKRPDERLLENHERFVEEVTEETRRARAQMAAEQAQAEQARHERAETERRKLADEKERRIQAENEYVAGRVKELLAISDGRIDGVNPDVELRSLDRLAREGKPIEQLRAAFEWFAENRGSGESLGWVRVDYGWSRYMHSVLHPEIRPFRGKV